MNHVSVFFLQEFPDCVILVAFAMHSVQVGLRLATVECFLDKKREQRVQFGELSTNANKYMSPCLIADAFIITTRSGFFLITRLDPRQFCTKPPGGILLVLRSTVAIPNPDHQIKTNM